MSGIRETILFSRATIFVALVAAATRAEEAVTLDGLADVFYLYNFNKPATGRGELRAYDGPHNCFHLNLAELSLEKRPAAGHRIGFRVDLDYGTTPRVNNAAEPAGMRRLQSAGQAYLSYLAPIGSGLRLDAGKFYTPIGNEVVRTSNNWNYSRSLLFTLAEPTYHAGIRASYTVNERVALSAHFVNGWNNVGDNNGAKSVGLQATLTPVPALSIVQTYVLRLRPGLARRSSRQVAGRSRLHSLSGQQPSCGELALGVVRRPQRLHERDTAKNQREHADRRVEGEKKLAAARRGSPRFVEPRGFPEEGHGARRSPGHADAGRHRRIYP